MIPDGPRGPRFQAKPGAVVLAQMSEAPIVPMSFAADRYWNLGSWDRMIIPKPFARIRVAVGPPRSIDRGLPADELERERVELERTLNELGAMARSGLEGS